MNSFLKKLFAGITLSALCLTTIIAPTTAKASEATTTIGLEISATIIDVTVTPLVTFTIDPNSTGSTTKTISIKNNTKAPVMVTLAGVTVAEGCDFNLVAPEKYSDWSKLNKAESRDIALRLTTYSGWESASATEYRTGTSDSFVGTINSSGTASFTVANIYHGRAFTDVQTASFNLNLAVELE